MTAQAGCIPCEIVARTRAEPGGTLYQDAYWYAGSVLRPVVWQGFTIVKLKRHCEQVGELTQAESAALGPLLQAGCQALMETLRPAKVYVCSFGDGSKHIHFWLLPRPPAIRPGMHNVFFALDLRLALTRTLGWKRWLVPDDVIEDTAQRLRASFQRQLGTSDG